MHPPLVYAVLYFYMGSHNILMVSSWQTATIPEHQYDTAMSRSSGDNETSSNSKMENTSISINGTPSSSHRQRNEWLAQIEIATLSVIFIVSFFSNAMMAVVEYRKRKNGRMLRIHFLLLQLSIADLMVAIFNVIPQLIWDITHRFVGSDLLCRAVKYMQVFPIYQSTLVLVIMAIDRLHVMIGATRLHGNTLEDTRVMTRRGWMMSALLSSPQLIIFSLTNNGFGEMDCWAVFKPAWSEKLYVTWFVCVVFFLPLIVVTVSYTTIFFKIKRFSERKNSSGNGHLSPATTSVSYPATQQLTSTADHVVSASSFNRVRCIQLRRTESQQKVSAAKMHSFRLSLTLIVCYILCWAPFCFSQIYLTYFPLKDDMNFPQIFVILLLLVNLNSCANPWIYFCFSKDIRNEFRRMMNCSDYCSTGISAVVFLFGLNCSTPDVSSEDVPSTNSDVQRQRATEWCLLRPINRADCV